MEKTLSKHWFDHEIKGVMHLNGRKVIYLKSSTKRLWKYNDHLLENRMQNINYYLIYKDRYEEYYKNVIGSEDNS